MSTRQQIELDGPIFLNELVKPEIRDQTLVVGPRYRNRFQAIVLARGLKRPTLKNVEIVGSDRWLPHWNDKDKSRQPEFGIWVKTMAVRFEDCTAPRVEDVVVHGFPSYGIEFQGCRGSTIVRSGGYDCGTAIHWTRGTGDGNRDIFAEDIWGKDTWEGPTGGPGGTIIAGNSCSGRVIRPSAWGRGEWSGIKFARSRDLRIDQPRTWQLTIQGHDEHTPPDEHTDAMVVGPHLDYGYTSGPTGNLLHVNDKANVYVYGGVIHGNGTGHGAQASRGSSLNFYRTHFVGIRGHQPGKPKKTWHPLELSKDSRGGLDGCLCWDCNEPETVQYR